MSPRPGCTPRATRPRRSARDPRRRRAAFARTYGWCGTGSFVTPPRRGVITVFSRRIAASFGRLFWAGRAGPPLGRPPEPTRALGRDGGWQGRFGRRFGQRAGAETQVEGWQHEEAEQRGGDETAQQHYRHRMDDLETGRVAHDHERQGDQRQRRGARQDRREPLPRPAPDEVRAKGVCSVGPEPLAVM